MEEKKVSLAEFILVVKDRQEKLTGELTKAIMQMSAVLDSKSEEIKRLKEQLDVKVDDKPEG